MATADNYKWAAEKHLVSCEIMCDKIDNLKKLEQDYLLVEIYYLSGYIIECTYNHILMTKCNFTDKDIIDQYQHDYKRKCDPIRREFQTFNGSFINPSTYVAPNLLLLYSSWETKIRYSTIDSLDKILNKKIGHLIKIETIKKLIELYRAFLNEVREDITQV